MVLATLLHCALFFLGGEPQVTTEVPNAANAWNALFLELDNIPYIDHKDGFQIPYYENEIWDENAQALRKQMAPFIERARDIAVMERCDWELDYSLGLDLLMPHLGHLREVQKMLLYSMRGEIESGDTSAALIDMNAMLGVTEHNTESELLIGSLVASSCFSLATSDLEGIDYCANADQLESLLDSADKFEAFDPFGARENVGKERDTTLEWLNSTENPDFALFQSITAGEIDLSNLDLDKEIEQYSFAMQKMEDIFQIKDKNTAIAAAEQLDMEIGRGGLGFLATALSPSSERLLTSVFQSEKLVASFKQVLRDKIDMIRHPNAATHFLRAVETYNAIDAKERVIAISEGDFTIIEEPLNLFTKACSMPPTKITFSESPKTPHWIAPLYSLSLDCIARGTPTDRLAIMEFVGHLSQQDRFAASILAAKLYAFDWGFLHDTQLNSAFKKARMHIPSADEFMLHRSKENDRLRLIEFCDVENEWNPTSANILAMTHTIARMEGVSELNPHAWKLFVSALLVPDDNAEIEVIIEDWMPENLLLLELNEESAFNEMMESFRHLLAKSRSSTTNPRGR